MNTWILQDEVGISLRGKMQSYELGQSFWWNVDRYIHKSNASYLQCNDLVLLWQPKLDQANPAGIYAIGRISREPYRYKNEKSNWRVMVELTEKLMMPITKDDIEASGNPDLQSMLIMRMAGGHIVFPVSPQQREALERLRQRLGV